ncbi:hypothetical protein PFICI_03657 [Pestalotiopsis fici W106-1]|uniref:Uncharacterized protein n=1 Tax=Pestalotiopsis fici (strain W106-1 / CGMCC3.15140) TaxID=1229662 RepID=W3XJJ7_PESFW|nr:uncharacterized protein PFICI_03657 [Pestalotiopsis fici W106-1]ETS85632.1 hypothetical protein PFICI_03657 [Pestalotiopsis fici W106-1]
MAPLGRKAGAIQKSVKSSDARDLEAVGPRVSETPDLANSEVDAVKRAASLTKDELQFAIEARASGMIDHLVEISKLAATDVSLEEVKSATEDHDQYVDSLGKKASAIQLNLDRCKTLMQSSDNWAKDRIEAKKSKLDALRAAKARLEATGDSNEQELKEAIARHSSRIEELVSGPPSNGAPNNNERPVDVPMSIGDDHFFGKLLDKLQALGLEINITDNGKTLVKSARYYSNL